MAEEDAAAKEVLALETSSAVLQAFLKKAQEASAWDEPQIRQILKEIGKEIGVKGKALYMTVRVAVSGQSHGPDLNSLLTLLGPKVVIKRINYTLNNLLLD